MTAPAQPRLVVFAVDALDQDLVERWQLPVLAALRARGCHARTAGVELVSEHGIWASLLSGRPRTEHGYYHWRPLQPGTYRLALTDLHELRALPFWAAPELGPALVVDAPEFPPLPGLAGVQVANWAPHNPRFPRTTEPAAQEDALRRRFGAPIVAEERVVSTPRHDAAIHRGLLARIEQKRALCAHLLREVPARVVVIGFHDAHIAGHQLWRYTQAGNAEGRLHGALREVYGAIDAAIGALLQQMPAGAAVFVLSNTGLAADHPNRDLTDAFCRLLGYRVPAVARRSATTRAVAAARRVLPSRVRRALIRALPRPTAEHLVAAQFENGTDWSCTTVFPIPSFYAGFLRVNLRGREPAGTVAPGAEYEATLARVVDDLRQLVDPVRGAPAVRYIVPAVPRLGETPPAALPDLFFDWAPTPYRKERIVHPRAELVQRDLDFDRATRHTHEGFVLAAGPAIAKAGALSPVDVLDVVPTMLRALGEPVPVALRGRPVERMLR